MTLDDVNEQRLESARRAFDNFNFEEKDISYGIKKVEKWEKEGNTYTLTVPAVIKENKKYERNDNVVLYVDFKDNSFELENVEACVESTGQRVGFMPERFYEFEKEKFNEVSKKFNEKVIAQPIVKKKTGFSNEFKF